MAGVMQDDAKLHKFCHDGKLEKIKVQLVITMHVYIYIYIYATSMATDFYPLFI